MTEPASLLARLDEQIERRVRFKEAHIAEVVGWRGEHSPDDPVCAQLDADESLLRACRTALHQPQQEQTAWLVALGSSPPQWWTGRGDEWTPDVDGTKQQPARCAIRFARREDAERAIGWLLNQQLARGCKAEEHLWC